MKYYKVIENDKVTQFAKQPNNIIPSFAAEITAEEYAQLKADFVAKQALIADYVEKVVSGEMTLEEVPTEYQSEVEAKLPTPTESTYTLDEAATILAQEVSA